MPDRDPSSKVDPIELPPQVQNLARREREIATIVYLQGPQTAKVLEERLGRDLSNAAVRSMLFRLCRKGILKRRKINGSHITTDRRIPYLYAPAITPKSIRERALEELARDYFDGSLQRVLEVLATVLSKQSAKDRRTGPRDEREVGIAA